MTNKTIAIIGGDTRQAYMAQSFLNKGYNVRTYGVELPVDLMKTEKDDLYAGSLEQAVTAADIIVGGIPFAKGKELFAGEKLPGLNLMELTQSLKRNQIVFGGMIPEEFVKQCEERGIVCYDFMKAESVAVFNAIATAEGAIMEAMKALPSNIHKSRCLILGFGRCGKALGEKLIGWSALVTVCSRCENERMYARAFGMKTMTFDRLEQEIHQYEYIFNTVPAVILDQHLLQRIQKGAVIIDIASAQGGVDYAQASRLNVKALHCLGIPGKYAPKTSADVLSDYCMKKSLPVLEL